MYYTSGTNGIDVGCVGAVSWYRYWTRPCCLQSEEDFYDRPTLNAQRERAMIQTH